MDELKNFLSLHRKTATVATVTAALLTGIANGLFGGGGGMLAVPAYTVFQGMETKKSSRNRSGGDIAAVAYQRDNLYR